MVIQIIFCHINKLTDVGVTPIGELKQHSKHCTISIYNIITIYVNISNIYIYVLHIIL